MTITLIQFLTSRVRRGSQIRPVVPGYILQESFTALSPEVQSQFFRMTLFVTPLGSEWSREEGSGSISGYAVIRHLVSVNACRLLEGNGALTTFNFRMADHPDTIGGRDGFLDTGVLVRSNIFRTEIPCVHGPQMRGTEGTPSWFGRSRRPGPPPYT